jgi:hypothetical protein
MSADARGCLGTVYRVVLDFLTERGMLEEVKARLTAPSRKVLEKLPFAFAWQDSAPLEEVEKLLYARSPDLVADLGHAAGRQLSGTLVAPVLKMALSLFGQTPGSLFGHLDRFFSIVVRGFSFQYEANTAKDGTVVARIEGSGIHRSLFEQLRGNLRTIYDLCNATGSVGAAQVLRHDDSGAEIRLPVRWD